MSISSNKSIVVRRVFAEDLDNELWLIKSAILRYPFVFMDTEFPGTIFKPSKQVACEDNPVINYHYIKSNVDALQIIQLGLSLSDAQGNLPDFDSPFCYVWEFNFKDFNINRDHYASTSIELLKRQGIDFEKNKEKGIDSRDFAKKLWDYGLVFNCYGLNGITWITFHGAYDFGFMLKILTQSPLPLDLHSFVHQLVFFFGYNIFDLKHTFKLLGLLGGLEKIAQTLNVARIVGSSHQAGSDSLLTLQCFMKLKSKKVFESIWNETNQILLTPLALYGLVQTIG
ncbi:putative CCR4-associated factor 1-like protein 11 [Gossypium australe]|uniref:poly(A)-specific ribonuclease n=1 Tax=Gossypium australe TaxID=47621 RepID=A0A5B6WN94_9ROSI|nr:putative CCR4-associated factor 1-like protein 11 [Gossypium australe]